MIKILLTSVLLLATSCHKKNVTTKVEPKKEVSLFASHDAKPIIVRVQDEVNSKIMSMTLKYSGKNGFVKNLEEQDDAVQNLIIAVLSDYQLKDLRTNKGKRNFQKNILTSLNEFVAENKFVGVELLGLKEI